MELFGADSALMKLGGHGSLNDDENLRYITNRNDMGTQGQQPLMYDAQGPKQTVIAVSAGDVQNPANLLNQTRDPSAQPLSDYVEGIPNYRPKQGVITGEESGITVLPQTQSVPTVETPTLTQNSSHSNATTNEYTVAENATKKPTEKKKDDKVLGDFTKKDLQGAQQALAALGGTSTASPNFGTNAPIASTSGGYQRRMGTPALTTQAPELNDPMGDTLGLVGKLFAFL
jgi:hypothetical protein